MKSIQIGSAASAPVSAGPSGFLSSWPTHTPTVMFGVEADEPRVGVVVGRARLPAERPLERRRRRRRAALHDAAQQVRHHVRRVGADRLARLRPVLLEQVALRGPRSSGSGTASSARPGSGTPSRRAITSIRLASADAERQREVRLHRALEPELPRVLHHLLRPDLVHRPHGRHVARLLERAAQRDRPFVLAVVVVRRVGRLARRRRSTTPACRAGSSSA